MKKIQIEWKLKKKNLYKSTKFKKKEKREKKYELKKI